MGLDDAWPLTLRHRLEIAAGLCMVALGSFVAGLMIGLRACS